MRFALGYALIAILSIPAYAQEPGLAKPNLVLQQIVEGLPNDAKQTVRVLTATFKPGDKTVYHSHRFPVTVYVVEGAFRLDLKDRPPLTVRAGEAMVEPPNVAMTGYNPSATELTKVVIFYVSTADTPFLDPLHHWTVARRVGRLGGTHADFNFDLHAARRIHYFGVTFRTRTTEEIRAIFDEVRKDIWPAVESRKLQLPIDKVYPFAEIGSTFAHMEANKHLGKIVVTL